MGAPPDRAVVIHSRVRCSTCGARAGPPTSTAGRDRVGDDGVGFRVVTRRRQHRRFALRHAGGPLLAHVLWRAGLPVPVPWRVPASAGALAVDLGTPMIAVRAATRRVLHRAERHGLFPTIVLGETILAASIAVRDGPAVDALRATAWSSQPQRCRSHSRSSGPASTPSAPMA